MKTLLALIAFASPLAATDTLGKFCLGFDPGGAPVCPCGHNGGIETGCLNSTGVGGALGTIPFDDYAPTGSLTLSAFHLQAGTPVMFLESVTATDAIFGDGRRCVGGSVKRLAVGVIDGTGEARCMVRDKLGYRMYQVWYRHTTPYCTPADFNMTNAVGVAWIP